MLKKPEWLFPQPNWTAVECLCSLDTAYAHILRWQNDEIFGDLSFPDMDDFSDHVNRRQFWEVMDDLKARCVMRGVDLPTSVAYETIYQRVQRDLCIENLEDIITLLVIRRELWGPIWFKARASDIAAARKATHWAGRPDDESPWAMGREFARHLRELGDYSGLPDWREVATEFERFEWKEFKRDPLRLATTGTAVDEAMPLTKAEADVLGLLRRSGLNKPWTLDEIEEELASGKAVVKTAVDGLIERGFAGRPHGGRKGLYLTPKGAKEPK